MAQHLTEHQIDSYVRQRLQPAELLSVTDHLAECEACRRPIQSAVGGDSMFVAMHSAILLEANEVGHPTPASMTSYVDGTLAGEELQVMTDHLTACDPCAVMAEDLRKIQFDEKPERRSWALQWAAVLVVLVGAAWWFLRPAAPAPRVPQPTDRLPPAYQRMVDDAITNQHLETSPLLAGLNRPGSALMGESDSRGSFSVVAPVGVISKSDAPAFRWSSLGGDATYVVEVYDEGFESVAKSPALSAAEWTPQQPLQRGAIYSWQVRAVKDGRTIVSPRPPAPQAKFRVLDAASAKEIDDARAAHPSSHLLLAVLSARAGLIEDAEKELRLLPDSPAVRSMIDHLPSPTSTKPAQ